MVYIKMQQKLDKHHNYKNKRIGNYLNNYKGGATVGKINILLKEEFPNL